MSVGERFNLTKAKESLVNYSRSREEKEERTFSAFCVENPKVTLNKDVILSASTRLELEEGLAKLRFHKIIYNDWGFSAVDQQGKSVILNFFGKPGTGKTLTAEAFAGSLNMPIIKLGIAELESKFMGETSKNIQAVFQAAAEANAVLFFDEADTLLGKRLSSVTQGIDNEVNAMRSTLLIELERFDGVVIFATNFAKNYDEAFRSRISHHICFELPDLVARKLLWEKMLVEKIPLLEERKIFIDVAAELSAGFSGREIRTCMRLVLPKILLEAESANNLEPKLSLSQLEVVIKSVRNAQKHVASNGATADNKLSEADVCTTKSLLGIKQ